jgi:hypothetical protein
VERRTRLASTDSFQFSVPQKPISLRKEILDGRTVLVVNVARPDKSRYHIGRKIQLFRYATRHFRQAKRIGIEFLEGVLAAGKVNGPKGARANQELNDVDARHFSVAETTQS